MLFFHKSWNAEGASHIKEQTRMVPVFKGRMLTRITLNKAAWHPTLVNQVREQKVDTGFEQWRIKGWERN